MPPLAFALASLSLTLGVWLHYLAAIPRERVSPRPWRHMALLIAAVFLGLAAIVGPSATLGSIAPAAAALGLALFFFYLLRQAPLPDGQLVVKVGQPLPLIEATSSEGELVRSSEWAGERVLFKFFRGQW